MTTSKIAWTKVDEAPALASYSFLPVVRAYTHGCGIEVVAKDISLAGRIVANFPDNLGEDQKLPNYLAELGELVKTPEANIVKLPNISASIPQLQSAISELQDRGYDIPSFNEDPKSDADKALRKKFAVALGSAVNPVLREGNSDRRAAASVKSFAPEQPSQDDEALARDGIQSPRRPHGRRRFLRERKLSDHEVRRQRADRTRRERGWRRHRVEEQDRPSAR